jgi:hypothetical protein
MEMGGVSRIGRYARIALMAAKKIKNKKKGDDSASGGRGEGSGGGPLGGGASASSLNPQSVTYKRARWKHFMRFGAFLMVLLMDSSFVYTAWKAHAILHMAFRPQEMFGYFLLTVMNMFLLPSMVLEVDKVIVTPEKIVLHNLVWKFQEKWDELRKFSQPIFLKFAILYGSHGVYLINKKDLSVEEYQTLVETIEHKAAHLQK